MPAQAEICTCTISKSKAALSCLPVSARMHFVTAHGALYSCLQSLQQMDAKAH